MEIMEVQSILIFTLADIVKWHDHYNQDNLF